RLGRYSEGNAALEKLRSDGSAFWSALAYVMMARGSPEAEQANQDQLQRNPHPYAPPELELHRLSVLVGQRSAAEASRALKGSLYGDDAYLWCVLVARRGGQAEQRDLVAWLERIRDLCGEEHLPQLYHRNQGLLHLTQGRFSEALTALRRASPGQGGEVSCLVLEGVALWGLLRFNEAAACWRKARRQDETGAFRQVSGLGLPTARLAAETEMLLPPRRIRQLEPALERAARLASAFPEGQREEVATLLEAATRGFPLAALEPFFRACRARAKDSPVYRLLEARILLSRCAYERCQAVLDELAEAGGGASSSVLNLGFDLALAQEDSDRIDAAISKLEQRGDEGDQRLAAVWRKWHSDDAKAALQLALELRAKHPDQRNLVPLTCYLLRKVGRAQEALSLAESMFQVFGYFDLGFARLRAVLALELGLGGEKLDAELAQVAFERLGVLDRLGDRRAALELARGAVLGNPKGVWFHSVPYWLVRYRRGGAPDESYHAVAGAYALLGGGPREDVLDHWQHVRQALDENYVLAFRKRFGEDPPTQGR
ncbi:MAG TPA: hypothetical protein DEA08_05720, partial [Planctomycetes bacterium]|nr:hypothetical protein [Planctomycetota bacterium]